MGTVPGKVFLICALFIFAVASWGTGADAAEKPSGQVVEIPEKVRIAAFPGTITALLYVAEEKGFFERHDLKASLTVYEAGITSLEDLAAGKIDIATVMEFPFAIGRVKMDDLRIIGSVAASKNLDLVMRRDRGISRPSDCRGRRIGVMQGTFGEFFLGVFLSFNGIGAAEIEKVDLRPSEMEEAIARGAVDGVIVWPPFVYEIKQKMGNQVVSWPAQGTQDSYALLVTKEAYIRSRPVVIERLLRALLAAQDYTEQHPAEAQKIVQRRFGYETPLVVATWPQNRLKVQLTQDLLTLMDDEARWAMQKNLFEGRKMPNFLNHIYLDALKKIRPEAVTIIH